MTLLSDTDRDRLIEFYRRALELHADGAVTTDSAIDYFMLVVSALDLHTAEAIQSMWSSLEDVWWESDA
jgi:hypothetical protein